MTADVDGAGDPRARALHDDLAATDGVQAVGEPQVSQDGTAALINVVPEGSPTSDVTSDLVDEAATRSSPRPASTPTSAAPPLSSSTWPT